MTTITERLAAEHRLLEDLLDALADALVRGAGFAERLNDAARAAREHYRREQPFLDRLALHMPLVAAKLAGQHEEACELAAQFEEAGREGHSDDALALARRFHAIAQHNVIEEERDVFPIAERCFTESEHIALLACS